MITYRLVSSYISFCTVILFCKKKDCIIWKKYETRVKHGKGIRCTLIELQGSLLMMTGCVVYRRLIICGHKQIGIPFLYCCKLAFITMVKLLFWVHQFIIHSSLAINKFSFIWSWDEIVYASAPLPCQCERGTMSLREWSRKSSSSSSLQNFKRWQWWIKLNMFTIKVEKFTITLADNLRYMTSTWHNRISSWELAWSGIAVAWTLLREFVTSQTGYWRRRYRNQKTDNWYGWFIQ